MSDTPIEVLVMIVRVVCEDQYVNLIELAGRYLGLADIRVNTSLLTSAPTRAARKHPPKAKPGVRGVTCFVLPTLLVVFDMQRCLISSWRLLIWLRVHFEKCFVFSHTGQLIQSPQTVLHESRAACFMWVERARE